MLKLKDVKNFIAGKVEEVEVEIFNQNPEYNRLSEIKEALYETIKNQLTEESQRTLLRLEDVNTELRVLENEIMYKQGLRDFICIRNSIFNKFLNLI